MTTKANGDPLEGTISTPVNYPNPVDQNVNMHPMEWSRGVGNKLIDFTVPTVGVLSTSAKSATTVTLNWTAARDAGSGVASYSVFKGGVLVQAGITALTYQVTGLTTATAYAFTVKAVDKIGNVSAASNSLSVTTS